MRIAIDKGPLISAHKVRGVGFYTKHLIKALGKKVYPVDFKKTDLTKYDLAHYPYFNPFFLSLPFIKPTKLVVTIHDVTPLIYPKHYPPGVRGTLRFLIQKVLLKSIDAVITDTEASKKDIVRLLGVPREKIFPIHLAPAKHFRKITNKLKLIEVAKKYQLPQKFVLYVGDVNYNKNVPGLIRTCQLANLPLVICGKQALEIEEQGLGLKVLTGLKDWFRFLLNIPHPELAHYKKIISHFEKNKGILRLGFIPDEDLVAIYNLATVYCQASFYEGFGLPILEAMACETPVVASRTQALVEIAEGGALFADPKKPVDLAKKIIQLTKNTNLRSKLVKNGKKKLTEYSWQKTAQKTLQIYSRVLSK